MHLCLQFHRWNKIVDFISFANAKSRASHSEFFAFLNNKILKYIEKKLKMLRFFVCVVFFLLEIDRKRKKYECDGLGQFATK